MNQELPDNRTLSHYRIVSKIGAGGMGEVYLAKDTNLHRSVAIKLLADEFNKDPDRLHRFIQEARAASALNHPNILTIYEVGENGGKHYIATEFIEGETLRRSIQQQTMTTRDALDAMVQVASALAAAHEAGIIHRDIKPENIMLRPDGFAKVLDFGLAKLTEKQPVTTDTEAATVARKETDPGTVMGTVQYMSPEQARGRVVDGRTDVFSLGVVLYEVIAGRTPFTGESSSDVLAAILEKEALPLSRFAPEAPSELQRIVNKSLRKKPDERYQTMRDLLLDLRELRDELALEAKLERSIRPTDVSSENQRTLVADAEITRDAGLRTSGAPILQTTSSAEYLLSQIQQHKRGAAVLLVILLLGATGLGYLLFWNRISSTRQIDSIAVMPFVSESGSTEVEYLTDGMTETLIGSLSQLPNLNVKSRSSVFRYKGKETNPETIGKELNVHAILNGRIIQRGDRITLSLELIDAQTENVIWSEQYSRKQADLVALQSDIARDVSSKLRIRLSGTDEQRLAKNYTTNPEAYQLYLKGRFYWNKRTVDGLKQAVVYYNQAIEKDPAFALAYSGLAETYVLFAVYSVASPRESMPQARASALKALEIDDSLAEAHAALGLYLSNYAWNQTASEKELRRAIELKPNYATAHHWYGNGPLLTSQRFEEAITEGRRAEELDPLSVIISADTAYNLLFARRYDEAIAQCQRTLTLDPNFYYTHYLLGWAYFGKGMYQEAIVEYRKSLELNPDPYAKALLALALAKSGRRSEAIKLRDELISESTRRYLPGYHIAIANMALGHRDEALAILEKDLTERGPQCSSLVVYPILYDLRNDLLFAYLVYKGASAKLE
jgi:serine/threonine-protein kinase